MKSTETNKRQQITKELILHLRIVINQNGVKIFLIFYAQLFENVSKMP